ncbi:MAG TPA: PHP-associated domain-containing protein [Candidatus Limnocylindria bacterium]|nr:PHP-associated domain-containing protein [Candidatus Limnocylindria bacterium]
MGRADLHVHSLASDGISSVTEIIGAAERAELDVIAITDHERMDAAVAARSMAEANGSKVSVIVGEEVTTRAGHVIGLFMTERIAPWGSLRSTVARIHEQGGLAIIPHPLVPYPLCVSGRAVRALLDDRDAIYHPDGIEAFNASTARMRWSRSAPEFARTVGLTALAGSDAHRAADVGHASITFAGTTPDDVRAAILNGAVEWTGAAYTWRRQWDMFVRQQNKNARAVGATAKHRLLRAGSGRNLGYPRASAGTGER